MAHRSLWLDEATSKEEDATGKEEGASPWLDEATGKEGDARTAARRAATSPEPATPCSPPSRPSPPA